MDTASFGARLLGLIEGRGFSQRRFAQAIDMDPTQLNRIIKGTTKRPDPETLRRIADALPYDYAALLGLAGYPPVGGENGTAPAPAPDLDGDRAFSPAAIVAYVESKPDPAWQAKLARQRGRRSPASYARLCLRIYRTWTSNADVVIDELEAVEQEI